MDTNYYILVLELKSLVIKNEYCKTQAITQCFCRNSQLIIVENSMINNNENFV